MENQVLTPVTPTVEQINADKITQVFLIVLNFKKFIIQTVINYFL